MSESERASAPRPVSTGGGLPPTDQTSILNLLQPELVAQEPGRVVLGFQPEDHWTIGNGIVQGGLVTAMLDMAMAYAAGGLSTATITVDILRPVRGPLLATGTVTKQGRRLLFASGELHDLEGQLLARGTQTAIPAEAVPPAT